MFPKRFCCLVFLYCWNQHLDGGKDGLPPLSSSSHLLAAPQSLSFPLRLTCFPVCLEHFPSLHISPFPPPPFLPSSCYDKMTSFTSPVLHSQYDKCRSSFEPAEWEISRYFVVMHCWKEGLGRIFQRTAGEIFWTRLTSVSPPSVFFEPLPLNIFAPRIKTFFASAFTSFKGEREKVVYVHYFMPPKM